MSTTFYGREDSVGSDTLVYEPFYPQNPGIIRRVISDKPGKLGYREIIVEVEWFKQTAKRKKITEERLYRLKDFRELINDHKRTYDNQSELADKLLKM